jgi:sec-independent protein translocase protein TatA
VFGIGPPELIVILIIALIVFGPARLPEIGRTVGRGLREFRRASQDIRGEIEGVMKDDDSESASTFRRPSEPKAPASTERDAGQRPAGEGTGPQASGGAST